MIEEIFSNGKYAICRYKDSHRLSPRQRAFLTGFAAEFLSSISGRPCPLAEVLECSGFLERVLQTADALRPDDLQFEDRMVLLQVALSTAVNFNILNRELAAAEREGSHE